MKRSYFITAVLIVFLSLVNKASTAQIVYTDIPDVTLKCSKSCQKTYELDLNNDQVIDFAIQAGSYKGGSNHCPEKSCPNWSEWVSGQIRSNNQMLYTPSTFEVSALTYGININSGSFFSGSGPLKGKGSGCTYTGCYKYDVGEWDRPEDYYLGLKLVIAGQNHYGWARLSVNVSGSSSSFTIKDYAYESSPGTAIISGETGQLMSVYSAEAGNEENSGNINFKISPNPASSCSTISFKLEKSSYVDLKVFDLNGKLVTTVTSKYLVAGLYSIQLTTLRLPSGIYTIRFATPEMTETKKLVIAK
jgi:hypothetical protein